MNTYVILLNRVLDVELNRETIDRHIAHLKGLYKSGQLILCGPFTDFPAGMIILRAPTKEDAIQIAQADPFVQEGVRTYEVRTWLLANEENNYLR